MNKVDIQMTAVGASWAISWMATSWAAPAKAIKDMGGILIKVINPNVSVGSDKHISEQLINKIKYDYEILNDKTIPDYYKKIHHFMQKL